MLLVAITQRLLLGLTISLTLLAATGTTPGHASNSLATPTGPPPPLPPSGHHPFGDRADRLLRQLTLSEKIGQMSSTAPAVTRAGGEQLIPAFEWWSECLHGAKVDSATEGGATIFPQPIALAASFDRQLVQDVASAIGDELRAKSNAAEQQGLGPRMTHCFGPNINLFRDPRWGRGSETSGEDPALTGALAKAFVRGLQGSHSRYRKAGATCKHCAAYSLEEWEGVSRFEFDARLDPRDVRDSYLPAFQACAIEAGSASVLCSYNAINSTPACANRWLLQEQLRGRMQFGGFVVSDCGAINSITEHHEWAKTHAEGFAAALRAGTDLACMDYSHIRQSLEQGLVTEEDIDTAVHRLLLARFALGHFDGPGDDNPYRRIPPSVVGSQAHLELARRAAAASTVLLKNDPPAPHVAAPLAATPLLPLRLGQLRRLAVLGPMANRSEYLLGSYYGYPSRQVTTPYQAIAERVGAHNRQLHAGGGFNGRGVQLELLTGAEVMGTGAETDAAVAACRRSDACIFFVGTTAVWGGVQEVSRFGTLPLLSPAVEGEGWDRTDLGLPGRQLSLIQAVAKRSSTPIAVVLVHGGPLDVEWLQRSPRVAAILTAWMPGQGGEAVADVLFGDLSPAGRLPITFYFQNYTAQSDFAEMSMRRWPGRTHRYLQVPALYPFGHGLSYTTFAYSGMEAAAARGAALAAAAAAAAGPFGTTTSHSMGSSGQAPLLHVSLSVANTGGRASDEVVLLLLSLVSTQQQHGELQGRGQRWWLPLWLRPVLAPRPAATIRTPCTAYTSGDLPGDLPRQTLAGFRRIQALGPGAAATIGFNLTACEFVPFSPLGGSSSCGSREGGCQAAVEPPPYCGDYLLRAGDQQLVVRLEQNAGGAGRTAKR